MQEINIKEFLDTIPDIKNKIKEIHYVQYNEFLGIGIIFVFGIIGMFLNMIIGGPKSDSYYFSLFMMMILVIGGISALYLYLLGRRKFMHVKNFLQESEKILTSKCSPDDILNYSEKIYNAIISIEEVNQYKNKAAEGRKFINKWELKEKLIELGTGLLAKLRNELLGQVNSNIENLSEAKSTVSENIHGTTELNQVSALQQVRLDKQIEQFEELQRVLVKA